MTREELAEIVRAMPPVSVRWAKPEDLPGVVEVAKRVACWWTEDDFREELLNPKVVLHVAKCEKTDVVRGFAVVEHERVGKKRFLTVLEMGAGDPVARLALIVKMVQVAMQLNLVLRWIEPKY